MDKLFKEYCEACENKCLTDNIEICKNAFEAGYNARNKKIAEQMKCDDPLLLHFNKFCLTNNINMDRIPIYLKDTLSNDLNYYVIDFFQYRFNWEETHEGVNYWHDINSKWVDYCRNNSVLEDD